MLDGLTLDLLKVGKPSRWGPEAEDVERYFYGMDWAREPGQPWRLGTAPAGVRPRAKERQGIRPSSKLHHKPTLKLKPL